MKATLEVGSHTLLDCSGTARSKNDKIYFCLRIPKTRLNLLSRTAWIPGITHQRCVQLNAAASRTSALNALGILGPSFPRRDLPLNRRDLALGTATSHQTGQGGTHADFLGQRQDIELGIELLGGRQLCVSL